MTDEKKQELTRRISVANSTDMVVILYDISLEYLTEAKSYLNIDKDNEVVSKENRDKLRNLVINIRRCINELIASLNYEYSPSGELLSLYVYCSRLLVRVDNKEDGNALDEIISIMSRLRDAYSQIASSNKQGPVMCNSQSVYAGLTYGRRALNESVISGGERGYLV